MKNNNLGREALKRLVTGGFITMVTFYGIIWMYISEDFIPVYDSAGRWLPLRQILRYGMYAILGGVFLLAAYAVWVGAEYLLHQLKRRRKYYKGKKGVK